MSENGDMISTLREAEGNLSLTGNAITTICHQEGGKESMSENAELMQQVLLVLMIRESILEILGENEASDLSEVYEYCLGDENHLGRFVYAALMARDVRIVSTFIEHYSTIVVALLDFFENQDIDKLEGLIPLEDEDVVYDASIECEYDTLEKRQDKAQDLIIDLQLLIEKIRSGIDLDAQTRKNLGIRFLCLHESMQILFSYVYGCIWENASFATDDPTIKLLMIFSAQLADEASMNYVPFLDALCINGVTPEVLLMCDRCQNFVQRIHDFTQGGENYEDIIGHFSEPFIEVNWSPSSQEVGV